MPLDNVTHRALLSAALSIDPFTPASSLVRADLAARSHPGVLKSNDDHYLVVRLGRYEETIFTSLTSRDVPHRFDEYAFAAVVADGIGSDGAGGMAARLAISTLAHVHLRFGQWSMRIDSSMVAEIMARSRRLYRLTHEAVQRWYREHAEIGRLGATMTAIYSAGTDLFVAHVGHSRCYLFRNGRLTQLTLDQTLRDRSDSRHLMAVRQEDGPHALTSAIGADRDGPRVIVEHFRLEDNDAVLLCTNGLTDMVSEDDIAETLASRRAPDDHCGLLIETALANGGHDNVTVVLANYHIPAIPKDEE